ncbi:TraR/DksA family transcriptional regulator [Oceanicella actignis]|uniref:TraR/DksA family transcriptional regulator n=1 Tax=Oceanicella actignis TaxID=1189325 RepID=UPI0011E82119|nr:TraR/DksA family transcriptional regulator [Oceanicella actignis]TYO91235.1 TraR/DksA family transcriptional regulator [Oceanicella actignis]
MKDDDYWREKLETRLRELEERLDEIEDELDETPSPDLEERAVEREGDEVLEGLGLSGLQEIRAIKAALERLDKGEYGWCAECGERIEDRRLELVPYAVKCAACARAR